MTSEAGGGCVFAGKRTGHTPRPRDILGRVTSHPDVLSSCDAHTAASDPPDVLSRVTSHPDVLSCRRSSTELSSLGSARECPLMSGHLCEDMPTARRRSVPDNSHSVQFLSSETLSQSQVKGAIHPCEIILIFFIEEMRS